MIQEHLFDIEQIKNQIFIVPLRIFMRDVNLKPSVQKNVQIVLNGFISKIQASHLESIGEGIAELENVHIFKFSFGAIEILNMFLEAQYQQGQAKLKKLQINTKINDQSFEKFCQHLKTFIQKNKDTLKSFYLDIPNLCNVTSQSLIALSQSLSLLQSCHNLEELQLGLAHWNVQEYFDESFPNLSQSLLQIFNSTKIKKLTLNFAGWNITNVSIQSLSGALSAFKEVQSLQELNLNFTLVFRCQQSAVDSLEQAFNRIFPFNKLSKLYICLNSWEFQKLDGLSKTFLNLKNVEKLCLSLNSKYHLIDQSEESTTFMKNILQLIQQNKYKILTIQFSKCDQNSQQVLKDIEKIIKKRNYQLNILVNQCYTFKCHNSDFYRKEIMWDTMNLINKDFEQYLSIDNNINFTFN